MSAELRLYTLGGLQIQVDDQPVSGFVSRKVDALLVYLAANPHPHPRELLAEMLWDDLDQSRSLTYLRTALASLQKQLSDYLTVTRQTIGINPDSAVWLDAAVLDAALNQADEQWHLRGSFTATFADQFTADLELYRGHFLEGFYVRDSRGFEGWMLLEQERLRMRVLQAWLRLGDHALKRRNYDAGIIYANNALRIDPLWEDAYRLLMRLLAAAGQRSSAIAQYELCKQRLSDELGVEPEQETVHLYEQIQQGTLTVAAPSVPHNLPATTTELISRDDYLAQITDLLGQDGCRLLTLVGPGGIGKTRLATEAAWQQLDAFIDGVYFVQLAPVIKSGLIANTIADTLNIQVQGYQSIEEAVIQHLKAREVLLVLDNFEHLLDGAGFIANLLAGADGVKIIATARERLNLHEEWLINVDSLPYPPADITEPQQIVTYAAVQLFEQAAKRMRPEFKVTDNATAVAGICRIAGGMPLAIELAASWTRMMSCAEIEQHLKQGLDILTTSTRNLPERHRSVRNVFESSWSLLNEGEQDAFRKLAVFRGSFDQTAAATIAGTSLFHLSSLVDKSMIAARDGRYAIHELLRQFADSKLAAFPEQHDATQRAFAHYYATLAHQRGRRLESIHRTPYPEMMAEIDNIRAAWRHAVEHKDGDLMDQFFEFFYNLYDLQNRYQEGLTIAEEAMEALNALEASSLNWTQTRAILLYGAFLQLITRYDDAQHHLSLVMPIIEARDETGNANWEMRVALRCLGNIAYGLGNYDDARLYYIQVRDRLLAEDNESERLARLYFRLSDIYAVQGDYRNARATLEESRQYFSQSPDQIVWMRYLITLGDVNYKLGELDSAKSLFEEAHELSQMEQTESTDAVTLVSLARVAIAQGRYDDAVTLCRQSIKRCEEVRNLWNKAFSTMHLARARAALRDDEEANRLFDEALALCNRIGSRWIEAAARIYRAEIHLERGQMTGARQDLRRALELADDLGAQPLSLAGVSVAADLIAQSGNLEDAAEIAAYVLKHPVSEYEARETARTLLAGLSIEDTPVPEETIETIAYRVQEMLATMP